MNIDDLTIRQAREIAAMFPRAPEGAIQPASAYGLHDSLVGCMVVVRSAQSGVWFGRLAAMIGQDVKLTGARKVWQWSGAGATSGLALTGPLAGKITPPVETCVVPGCCEVLSATDVAVTAFAGVVPWTGR